MGWCKTWKIYDSSTGLLKFNKLVGNFELYDYIVCDAQYGLQTSNNFLEMFTIISFFFSKFYLHLLWMTIFKFVETCKHADFMKVRAI